MTRIELFKGLCEATDALEHALRPIPASAFSEAARGALDRLEGLIDRCVREGMQPLHDGDRSPCPACGQPACTHWQLTREER